MNEMQNLGESQIRKIYDVNSINQPEYIKSPLVEMKIFDKISNTLQNQIIIKDFQYLREKIIKIIRPILIFLGFGLSYLFYYFSLESCFDGEGPCATYIDWIKSKVIEEIISCLLLIIMIQMMILNIISKMHLIHITSIFIFFYYFRHGMNFVDHGYFNIFFFIYSRYF